MNASNPGTTDLAPVQTAYDSWASVYIDLFGSTDKASEEDRTTILEWSKTVVGPVLDAGCGPGHWSAFLHSLGLQVEGVDATAAFIEHATRTHPDVPFRLGDLRHLDLAPDSLGGILAWFSLIHLDPDEIPDVMRLFSTALRPGGTMLLGFFSGDQLRPFDHRVITAWSWPLTHMERTLEQAGLEVVARDEHPQPSGRIFAELIARQPR